MVHGLHGISELFAHRLRRAATLANIALYPAPETKVQTGIEENTEIEQLTEALIVQDMYTLDQNELGGLDRAPLLAPGMIDVVVAR